ncbi:MAG: hypothetical protein ACI892_002163, partial [Marinobacter maritimus]
MKNIKWLVLSSLLLSNVVLSEVVKSTENDSWSAQSTEKQFEQTSKIIYKASKDEQANQLALTPSAMSKNATTANSKKGAQAKILSVRPEAKAFNQEFWIFDAWVEFYSDND